MFYLDQQRKLEAHFLEDSLLSDLIMEIGSIYALLLSMGGLGEVL